MSMNLHVRVYSTDGELLSTYIEDDMTDEAYALLLHPAIGRSGNAAFIKIDATTVAVLSRPRADGDIGDIVDTTNATQMNLEWAFNGTTQTAREALKNAS